MEGHPPASVEKFTHRSISRAAPHDHPRSDALLRFKNTFETSMLPSSAAETSVIVPFRPTAGIMDEMCFEYGAVQIMTFAPPRDWMYSTTFVADESMCAYAPSDFARAAFDGPNDTA